MQSPEGDADSAISEVTRRAIVDHFSVGGVSWSGRLQDDEFLSRLYDLTSMPSFDQQLKDAAGDIYQHTVRNSDWDTGWIFYDSIAILAQRSLGPQQTRSSAPHANT